MRPFVVRLALPLLAGAALIPALRDAWRALRAPRPLAMLGPDYLQRFASAKAHLRDVALVCYVFDPTDFATVDQAANDPVAAARAQRATFEMYLAQRALAPTLVRPDPAAAWVLVNYQDRTKVPSDWPQRGLELIDDPGNGVVLFKVKGR